MPLLHLENLPRRTTKSELLAFMDKTAGIDSRRLGRIAMQDGQATLEIPDGWESRLIKILDGKLVDERRIRAWISGSPASNRNQEDHLQRLQRLLDMESKAEAQQAAAQARRLSAKEAELAGNTLIDLVVADEEAGLGGRYILHLMKRNRAKLPWTRLAVGNPVVLSQVDSHATDSHRGVICERREQEICVALEVMPEDMDNDQQWRVDLSFDEIAIQRQRAALEQARLARGDRFAILRDVLLGQRQPEFGVDPAMRPLDQGLNEVQRDAVQFALSARDVGLIHGPPGTGKTTAVVEVIRQAVRRGKKVLACAPSNLAVDNIFERLIFFDERAVRLGHPARVLPELREHTLDLLVEKHRDVRLARKLVKQAMILFREAGRYTRTAPKPGARRQLREDAKSLLADARKLERQAVENILDSSHVLCATTTSLDSQILGTRRFDLVVIDEACQSTEPGCWIPILRGDRVVLAGDHCQLPPTVVSQEAAADGFGVSLFERLMALNGVKSDRPPIARQLTVQYRMHQAIMDFSSVEFYDGQLEAAEMVRGHLLNGLPGVADVPLKQSPVEFIDTAGASYDEEIEPDGESRLNRQEAALICRKTQELMDCGVAAGDIAVIAPYAAQVRLLRELLPIAGLEIDSVDGFQGREKEAVVISLVRSNPKGEIGFLADVRRINVALTRARRKLLVVGDSATLSGHPFYKRMIEYFENIGAYKTVWEEG